MSFDTEKARDQVQVAGIRFREAEDIVRRAKEDLRGAILNQIEVDAGAKINRAVKGLVADLISKKVSRHCYFELEVNVDPDLESLKGSESGKTYFVSINIGEIFEEHA